MKVKVITTATNRGHPGFKAFKKSLDLFGWPYEISGSGYTSFMSKAENAYNYAKETDCTHLFILDSYDIIVLGTMEEALVHVKDSKATLFNAEKACWPYPDLAKSYPKTDSPWKYLNGGACFTPVDNFIKIYEQFKHTSHNNDQVIYTNAYLFEGKKLNIDLDTNCDIFQSIAFEEKGDFSYNQRRLINNKTKTTPIIIHGNGKTNMEHIYKL